MKAAFLVLILLIVARTTSSQIPHSVPPGTEESYTFSTGNQLLRKCQSENEKLSCTDYIIGAADMVGALQGALDRDEKSYWKYQAVCLPLQVDSGQVRDVVVKYLVDHPERRDQPASQMVLIALIATWGCPRAPAS
jgi:hypothetical protein